MEANFDPCMAFTLPEEGGYVNDPDDAGGATNRGITLNTLRDYRGDPDLGVADIKALSEDEAKAIYHENYWPQCAALPSGVDLMVFDMGVNAGPGRAIMQLQGILQVALDGHIGPQTLAQVAKHLAHELVASLGLVQTSYYKGLTTFWKFGKGWLGRVDRRETAALKMATA